MTYSLFRTHLLAFQLTERLWGFSVSLCRRLPRPGRDVSALSLRPIVSLATRHSPLPVPLCFHILTNCFSRKPFVFTTIRIARGCGVQRTIFGARFRKRYMGKAKIGEMNSPLQTVALTRKGLAMSPAPCYFVFGPSLLASASDGRHSLLRCAVTQGWRSHIDLDLLGLGFLALREA